MRHDYVREEVALCDQAEYVPLGETNLSSSYLQTPREAKLGRARTERVEEIGLVWIGVHLGDEFRGTPYLSQGFFVRRNAERLEAMEHQAYCVSVPERDVLSLAPGNKKILCMSSRATRTRCRRTHLSMSRWFVSDTVLMTRTPFHSWAIRISFPKRPVRRSRF
jgi:hypothetical protein